MKTKMQLAEAEQIAMQVRADLLPYCQRIETAGSIRRHKLEVGDIEIVCMPKLIEERNLFGEILQCRNELEDKIGEMTLKGWRFIKNGNRFKQLVFHNGISLDLFICLPPAQWGVLFAIRTGPRDFSTWIVTQRNKGGALPSNLHVKNGVVWHGSKALCTPEEDDFLGLCGLAGVPAEERRQGMPCVVTR